MFEIKIVSSIHAIDPSAWDRLSAVQPFQSHRWYVLGERAMADCQPIYLLVYKSHVLIARACFWLIRNEPLPPKLSPFIRLVISSVLKRWPLLVCRSPLANATGLILPEGELRDEIILELTQTALTIGKKNHASVLIFDFLRESDLHGWPSKFSRTVLPNSGTIMESRWQSMEEYLGQGNKKDRQHYKRSLREAQKIGLTIRESHQASNVDSALKLIRIVEQKHGSPPNPWIPALLENINMVNGIWLEVYKNARLVGCGLILEDNGVQMTAALGLAENEPYVYFMLVYTSLESAFNNHVKALRWGAGAYDVKRRLGFNQEPANHLTFVGIGYFTNLLSRLVA